MWGFVSYWVTQKTRLEEDIYYAYGVLLCLAVPSKGSNSVSLIL